MLAVFNPRPGRSATLRSQQSLGRVPTAPPGLPSVGLRKLPPESPDAKPFEQRDEDRKARRPLSGQPAVPLQVRRSDPAIRRTHPAVAAGATDTAAAHGLPSDASKAGRGRIDAASAGKHIELLRGALSQVSAQGIEPATMRPSGAWAGAGIAWEGVARTIGARLAPSIAPIGPLIALGMSTSRELDADTARSGIPAPAARQGGETLIDDPRRASLAFDLQRYVKTIFAVIDGLPDRSSPVSTPQPANGTAQLATVGSPSPLRTKLTRTPVPTTSKVDQEQRLRALGVADSLAPATPGGLFGHQLNQAASTGLEAINKSLLDAGSKAVQTTQGTAVTKGLPGRLKDAIARGPGDSVLLDKGYLTTGSTQGFTPRSNFLNASSSARPIDV